MFCRQLVRNFSKSFKAADLKVSTVKNQGLTAKNDMTFGSTHTAHMFMVNNDNGTWGTPQIMPYAPIPIDPFNSTLHYSISCFEGLKAYVDDKNRIRLFRPQENMKRFQRSCARMALPAFDEKEMLKCVEEFTKVEKNWIPKNVGEALYLRPFAFSDENTLGVKPPTKSKIMIVAGPVGNYFEGKYKPITLGICRDFERGTPHSAAGFKVSSNYAPTIAISGQLKREKGCDQVLWLYKDRILEVGACNIFFLIKNKSGKLELITSPLDGSVLPGITRDSVIKLEKEKGRFIVTEREITITEIEEISREGRLVEIFGTGTAVCIMPVANIRRLGALTISD